MNPFGTTRQAVGGQNQYEPPRPRHWYDVVPFHPCRPPTPPWIVDWPLEVLSRGKAYMLQFSACRDVEELLQDARTGMIPGLVLPTIPPTDPGPAASDNGFVGTQNVSGNRIWVGRTRGFGFTGSFPNRHIAVSPLYQGPARITSISWIASLQGGGGAQPRDTWALGVGDAQNIVDTSSGDPSAALNGFTVFDMTVSSDQQNEQIPTTLGYIPNALNVPVDIAPAYSPALPVNIPIPLSSFKLWLAMNTYGVNASAVTVIVSIETQQSVAERTGEVQSLYNPPPTWARNYIG